MRGVNKEWTMMSLYNETAYDEMIARPNSGKTVSKRLDYFSYKELPTFDLRLQLENVNIQAIFTLEFMMHSVRMNLQWK